MHKQYTPAHTYISTIALPRHTQYHTHTVTNLKHENMRYSPAAVHRVSANTVSLSGWDRAAEPCNQPANDQALGTLKPRISQPRQVIIGDACVYVSWVCVCVCTLFDVGHSLHICVHSLIVWEIVEEASHRV